MVPGGALESTFDPEIQGTVMRFALQPDGRVLIGGEYMNIAGIPRNGFSRMMNDPASSVLQTQGSTTVRWLRNGTAR